MEHQGSQGRGGEYGVYDRVPGEGGAGKVEAPKEPGYIREYWFLRLYTPAPPLGTPSYPPPTSPMNS